MRLSAMTVSLAGVFAAGLLAVAGTAPASAAATPPPRWIHIAAGSFFSCGIRAGNSLWCWGDDLSGELGNGPTDRGPVDHISTVPQQVTRKTAAWTSVTAGSLHACATRRDGTLWCWGDNSSGQVGTGAPAVPVFRPQQVISPAGDGWVSAAAGGNHTCAIRGDATLWCWGASGDGELGTGGTTSQDRPQQVTAPAADGWASVSAGGDSTCAVRADATLWCWGDDSAGELGTGGGSSQDTPQQVTAPAAGGWATVTAGDRHACATRTDGTLWCWGGNGSGQLGLGTGGDQDLPQQVTSPAAVGWTSVTAGYAHTCATRTHALWCWGSNVDGDLGIGGTTTQNLPRRVPVPSRTGWSLAALGEQHTCATRTGHALYCWGNDADGQLGSGGTEPEHRPRQVTG